MRLFEEKAGIWGIILEVQGGRSRGSLTVSFTRSVFLHLNLTRGEADENFRRRLEESSGLAHFIIIRYLSVAMTSLSNAELRESGRDHCHQA